MGSKIQVKTRNKPRSKGPTRDNPLPVGRPFISKVKASLQRIATTETAYLKSLTDELWTLCGDIADELARTRQTQEAIGKAVGKTQAWVGQKIGARRKALAIHAGPPKSEDERRAFVANAYGNGKRASTTSASEPTDWHTLFSRYVARLVKTHNADNVVKALQTEADSLRGASKARKVA